MHFVNQIDLVPALCRSILHIVQQLPGVFYLGARGRINFQQVDKITLINLAAALTLPAGGTGHPFFTIQALGQDARNGGFAYPASTAEEIGMMQPSLLQRVDEGSQYMLLAHHLVKIMGAPFACQYLICHLGHTLIRWKI